MTTAQHDPAVDRRWRQAAVWSTVAALLAVAAVAVSGLMLAWRYRPVDPWSVTALPRPSGLIDIHRAAFAIALVLVVAWSVIATWYGHRASSRIAARRGGEAALPKTAVWVLVAGMGAGLLVVVTWLTWSLVAWDQIALRSVTVGSGVGGWWQPAFGGDVAFVLVDGVEVSQRTYAAALVVHLAAPAAAVALLAFGAHLLWRQGSEERQQVSGVVEQRLHVGA